MIIRKDYMHFFIWRFLVHRLSFWSCKVQIILRFKSRLHIQYIVHGFRSIIHWLLCTLFSHISFHRKKIHYPLYQHWWMFSGLYDMGEDGGGGEWRSVHIVSVDATLSYTGGQTKRKRSSSNTHAYRLHIDHLNVFPLCMSLFFYVGALSQRADIAAQTNKSSESSNSHSVNMWVFDVQQQNIAKCVSSAWKVRFKCAVSSQDQHVIGAGIKHNKMCT